MPAELTAASGGRSPRKQRALALFAGLPRRYDLLATLFSLGQDPRWRRAMVSKLGAREGQRVLDVATGTGMVAAELVSRCGCLVTALDQSEQMLAAAHRRVESSFTLRGRVKIVHGEAERLPFEDGEFDALTFTYLLRYVDDPGATLTELARVVRPGGRIAALEFGVPPAPAARLLWEIYTRLALPALCRLVSGDWYQVGRFLGPSIRDFYERYPSERIAELWRAAGIRSVGSLRMSLGGGVVMWGVRDSELGAAT